MTEQVLQRVEQCYAQAEQYFARPFARPEINFELRGKAAGVAHIERNLLRFNWYLYQHNKDDFLRQTVAHEIAHLLAYRLYGRDIQPHGQQWQAIMRQVFELPAKRCHQYQLKPRWKTFYLYSCNCRSHEFSARRHTNAKRGSRYLCRHCKQPLVFTGDGVRRLE